MSVFDSFPPKNLSPESTEWGREVENRIFQLANGNKSGDQSLIGLNRTTASTLETLAGQVRILGEQVTRLNTQVQRVNDAYAALPSPVQASVNPTNFGVGSSGTWNTIATASITAPKAGTLRISATGTGMLRSPSTSTNMELSARLVINGGDPSATIPGNFESPDGTWRNSFFVPWGWTASVSSGQVVSVSLQVNPVDASSWPGGTGSYAVLSVQGAVTG